MNNPHLAPLESNYAQAQQRLSTAQAQLEATKQNYNDAIPAPRSAEERSAAVEAVCSSLRKPWPLTLGILALSPIHAGGLWLALRTRRLISLAEDDQTPSLDHLPRKSDAQSTVAFVSLSFVLGLLATLVTLAWCRDSSVERLWFISFHEAYQFLDSFGLPKVHAITITASAFGLALLVLITSKVAGLFGLDGEEVLVGGGITAGISFLLIGILGITLGGLLAEHRIGLGMLTVPGLIHAVVYLKAALKRTTFNESRLHREFEEWLQSDGDNTNDTIDELNAKIAQAEAACRLAAADAELTRAAVEAESARWAALSRVEQLQEIQLLKNIEATQSQIDSNWITAAAADREARAAEYRARREAEAAQHASRFSAQQAAEAARERRDAEKAAKEAARPVCRYCGKVEPRMTDLCPHSPTRHHVLLR